MRASTSGAVLRAHAGIIMEVMDRHNEIGKQCRVHSVSFSSAEQTHVRAWVQPNFLS